MVQRPPLPPTDADRQVHQSSNVSFPRVIRWPECCGIGPGLFHLQEACKPDSQSDCDIGMGG